MSKYDPWALLLFAWLGLFVAIAGCVTTTQPDGTSITAVDTNLVAAILPSVLDLANRYLAAQAASDAAEAEQTRIELENRRALMESLITDPDLRREVLSLIDGFLRPAETPEAPIENIE